MTDLNSVSLTGNIAKSDLKFTKSGTPKLEFTIAVSESVKKDSGYENYSSFFDCVVWGKYGEAMSPWVTKGIKVAVSGKLRQERWESEGQKRSKCVLGISSITLLSPKKEAEGDFVAKSSSSNNYGHKKEDFDDDIPF